MSDTIVEGDMVTVTLTGKVDWAGEDHIEIVVPGLGDGHMIVRDAAEITKVDEPLPIKVGSVVQGKGTGRRYFLTDRGWMRDNGMLVTISMGLASDYAILKLVE